MVLAAGRGTRMGELTDELPKPMLQVRGMPILEHILRGILGAGADAVHLITGWKEEAIRGHFGDGSAWGASVSYSTQEVPDGTGKAPELAREFIGNDSFLLTYGDILVDSSAYQRLARRHAAGDCVAAMAVVTSRDVAQGGICLFDEGFRLRRLVEKPGAGQLEDLRRQGWIRAGQPLYYNAGVYLFGPSLFDYTRRLRKSPRGEYELTDAIGAMAGEGRKVVGVEIEGPWDDVRDPGVLARVQ